MRGGRSGEDDLSVGSTGDMDGGREAAAGRSLRDWICLGNKEQGRSMGRLLRDFWA